LGRLRAEDAARRAATDPAGFVCLDGRGGTDGRDALGLSPHDPPETAAERIAAVQFDRKIVRGLLGTDADTAAADGVLEYHRDAATAVTRATPAGAAFLLPPVGLDAVWRATSDGVRLPPKSTYFEPKIPSGLLFRTL
ncbi:MAG: hypothetical protein ACODAA_03050, partial [Gemmatimonadota bacterium]